MVKYIPVLILILLITSSELLQQDKTITLKKAELDELKAEIKLLQLEYDSKNRKEKESYAAVENISRQAHLLNMVINTIRSEETAKTNQILLYEKQIENIRSEIKKLQDNYAAYVRAVYKYGKNPDWSAFIDASSIKQAVKRIEYLKRFSEQREKDLIKLEASRTTLTATIHALGIEREEKRILALKKEEEKVILNIKLKERKNVISAIKYDKAELKKELNVKKNAESVIKNLIARLVEEAERKRREEAERLEALERERQLASSKNNTDLITEITKEPEQNYDIDLSTSSFTSFAAAKGSLKWPLQGGRIIRKYGENRNKQLNTVTLNYGVDIKAGKDINVTVVADGVVSALDWVPGYGSVIIVTHKGDYRTVYSHLSEIFVKEGDRLKSGALIGRAEESTEGHILHFEIWNSRTNQNPELWLSKK